MRHPIRVAIIEDDPPTREGLRALIDAAPNVTTCGSFESMEEALDRLNVRATDVVLLDLKLPGMSGIDGIARLRERRPDLPILVLTVYDDNEHVFPAICAGAFGYLLKDTPPARLLQAIEDVHRGGAPLAPGVAQKVLAVFQRLAPPAAASHRLSPRERQVLDLLAEGHSYKTAAEALGLSQDTIRFHIRHIYDKLHVHSKSEAVVKALRANLIR